MSQENVELLYRTSDAFNRRDIDAALALYDPDVEFIRAPWSWRAVAPTRGHEGVRSWVETLLGVFPDFRTEIDEVRDLGDVTDARVRLRGQGTESDVPMEQASWVVIEWRHRKCARWRTFRSEDEALEAAGLRE